MWMVPVRITASTSSDFPGRVACELIDAHGQRHSFEEKAPVVADASFDISGSYPQAGEIGCVVVASWLDRSGRLIATIDTAAPWGIESTKGQTLFEVLQSDLRPRTGSET